MRYVPSTATYDGTATNLQDRYELGSGLVDAVKYAIPNLGLDPKTSPEAEFLELAGHENLEQHICSKIGAYVKKINEQLKTTNGVLGYMRVAESKRRLFRPPPRTQRPLHPLAEFDMSLPYANKVSAFNGEVWSMKPDGTVESILPPERVWHPRNTQTHFSASGCPFSASF